MEAENIELAKYTVESNSLVTLFFKTGRSKKVRVANLAQHVTPDDLAKIQQSLDLRKSYFKELPKWAKAIAIPAAAIVIGLGAIKAAPGIERIIHHAQPVPLPAAHEVTTTAPATTVRAPVQPTVATPESQPATSLNVVEPVKPITKSVTQPVPNAATSALDDLSDLKLPALIQK